MCYCPSKLITLPFLLLYLLTLNNTSLLAQSLSPGEVTAWATDLDVFATEFWRIFPDADTRVDRQVLEQALDELRIALPTLEEAEVVIQLQSILALSTEGSNTIWPYQKSLNYPMLPIKTYRFADGWFVCDAVADHEELIGKEIISVNGLSTDALWEKLVPMMPGDNIYQRQHGANYHWQIAPWLQYLTEEESSDTAVLTFADGASTTIAFQPTEAYHGLSRKLPSYRGLVSSDQYYENDNYWMEYLPESKALVVQFLAIRDNEEGPKFKQFVNEMVAELNSGRVERLIVDNRYGGGGNGFKLKPLTDLLREHELFQNRGNLIVLTGRSTRGTVQEMSSILELNTKAVFIGEPTGEGPNSVGDLKAVTLPESGIDIWVVHKYWPTSWNNDGRETLEPEVYVFSYYQDIAAGKDPWLEAALAYEPEPATQHSLENTSAGEIAGKYIVNGYTLEIEERRGRLFLAMNRKLKSFFEIHTELYPVEEGVYATDIVDVYLKLDVENSEALQLIWKGTTIELARK